MLSVFGSNVAQFSGAGALGVLVMATVASYGWGDIEKVGVGLNAHSGSSYKKKQSNFLLRKKSKIQKLLSLNKRNIKLDTTMIVQKVIVSIPTGMASSLLPVSMFCSPQFLQYTLY